MINTFRKNNQPAGTSVGWMGAACCLVLLLSGCAVDSGDGDSRDSVELPTDFKLDLYCADVGLFNETCVLDDPDNPYRSTPFATDDPDSDDPFKDGKFLLVEGADSPKARFYVWATALARRPNGENQFGTALSLHELYTLSDSELIKNQAIRAYRSVLDNFFDDPYFFRVDFLPSGLPEDFEGAPNAFADFGGNVTTLIDNPFRVGNDSDTVARMVKNRFGGTPSGGTTLTLDAAIDFFQQPKVITMQVWSSRVASIEFKVEGQPSNTSVVKQTAGGSAWETISFDFTGLILDNDPPTPITAVSIFFDNGALGNAETFPQEWTFYIDNIQLGEDIFYPQLVRDLATQNLGAPGGTLLPLFDELDANVNEFQARALIGSWGFTWLGLIDPDGPGGVPPTLGPVYKN